MLQQKPKILVEIYDATGMRKPKKYPIEGNKVIIEKPRRGPGGAGYMPTFDEDCLIPYQSGPLIFKRLKLKLMLKYGTNKCMSIRGEKTEIPSLDKDMVESYCKAHVIKSAGATTQRIQIPTMFYILMALLLIIGVVNLLVGTGRVRFA